MLSILLIEDDFELSKSIVYNLESVNYKITTAFTGVEAFSLLNKKIYDLIILDVNLPDCNGFEIYEDLQKLSKASIIFLTANDLESDIIKGYDLGADDYITKPFSPKVLQRKINALFNRLPAKNNDNIFKDHFLYIDFSSGEAKVNNRSITLTPLEFRLLKYLIINKNHILKRDQILNKLWDSEENYLGESSLNAVISRIRSKIEDEENKYIKTIYGTGYMWIGD